MILVGTRDSNIKNGTILNEKCPNCDQESSLHFSIYRRYTHLTLIPLFPVGKLVFVNCNDCNETFDYEDLSENIQLKLKNEKLNTTPWMFLGSFILVAFISFSIINYFDKKDETSILIQNPIAGDVYNLKFPNGYYSNMRIDKVTKDSIYTTNNDFDAYMPYEIDDLDTPDNFSDQKVYYSRKDILKLYQEDEIIKIIRKPKNFSFSN